MTSLRRHAWRKALRCTRGAFAKCSSYSARDAYRAMSRYPLGTVGDPVVLEAEGEGEEGAAVTA